MVDYSDRKFNLDGRICGLNVLLFGACEILVIYNVKLLLEHGFCYIPKPILIILTVIVFLISLVDRINSLNVLMNLKRDSTQDFTNMVQEITRDNHQFFKNVY